MARLRILIVDDEEEWRDGHLPEIFAPLAAGGGLMDRAGSFSEARARLSGSPYDLAVVDLALLGPAARPQDADEQGLTLLEEMRRGATNPHCAVLVITGTNTTDRFHRALQKLGVERVIPKDDLPEDSALHALAKRAILKSRLLAAAGRDAERIVLTLTSDRDGWVEVELKGPKGARIPLAPSALFNGRDLARRANRIGDLLRLEQYERYAGSPPWRDEVESLGTALFEALQQSLQLHGLWTAATVLARNGDPLSLRFQGPAEGFAIPFDLMRADGDHLCLHHVLSRSFLREGLSHPPSPLPQFVQTLLHEERPLRLLLVAANSDGGIPAVEREAALLETEIRQALEAIGLPLEPILLTGSDASYDRVRKELSSRSYHLFHFAGHGRHGSALPETGGLDLRHGPTVRTLTANELNLLATGSALQLVFLNCCSGAWSSDRPKAGEFWGVYDALSRAEVPAVVGHRWLVRDHPALGFASSFYDHLWRSFSPGEALLRARQAAATEEWGRDDPTWASPVLLMR